MEQSAQSALRSAKLLSDGKDYHLVRLPANAITLAAGIVAEAALPFCAMVVDEREVSLLLPAEVCAEFSRRLRHAELSEQVYRLITFDAPLEPTLVGFIAKISACLAEAEIPLLSYAAYSRDHIFVPTEQFSRAMSALQALQRDSG